MHNQSIFTYCSTSNHKTPLHCCLNPGVVKGSLCSVCIFLAQCFLCGAWEELNATPPVRSTTLHTSCDPATNCLHDLFVTQWSFKSCYIHVETHDELVEKDELSIKRCMNSLRLANAMQNTTHVKGLKCDEALLLCFCFQVVHTTLATGNAGKGLGTKSKIAFHR